MQPQKHLLENKAIIDNNFAFYNPFDKVLYKYNDNNMLYVEKQDK